MHADLLKVRAELTALCRRFQVERLEVFGSAARGTDFDPARSDVDFLVTFTPEVRNDMTVYLNLKDALAALVGRPVDLIEREAVEASPNYIRRRRILAEAEPLYG